MLQLFRCKPNTYCKPESALLKASVEIKRPIYEFDSLVLSIVSFILAKNRALKLQVKMEKKRSVILLNVQMHIHGIDIKEYLKVL